jgi:hypothetical protein
MIIPLKKEHYYKNKNINKINSQNYYILAMKELEALTYNIKGL